MKEPTRLKKETIIIEAAEHIFQKMGFKNARMKDIAKQAGVTKVTLYTYFQSKDNLYMAITYRAIQALIEKNKKIESESSHRNGLELSLELQAAFMDFCESNFLYSECLLEYFSIIRSTSLDNNHIKLTDGMKESNYFEKVVKIHNMPFKISASAIQKGIEDGSIHASIEPMLFTLFCWTNGVGYAKIQAASGDTSIPLFKFSLSELKALNLGLARSVLTTGNPLYMTSNQQINQKDGF